MDDTNVEPQSLDAEAPGAGLKQINVPIELPIKPKACRNHIRKEAAKTWGAIVDKLLAKAKEGSVSHITLVVKLAGFEQGPMAPKEPKRRGKSLAQQLREEMEELEARNIAEFGE